MIEARLKNLPVPTIPTVYQKNDAFSSVARSSRNHHTCIQNKEHVFRYEFRRKRFDATIYLQFQIGSNVGRIVLESLGKNVIYKFKEPIVVFDFPSHIGQLGDVSERFLSKPFDFGNMIL